MRPCLLRPRRRRRSGPPGRSSRRVAAAWHRQETPLARQRLRGRRCPSSELVVGELRTRRVVEFVTNQWRPSSRRRRTAAGPRRRSDTCRTPSETSATDAESSGRRSPSGSRGRAAGAHAQKTSTRARCVDLSSTGLSANASACSRSRPVAVPVARTSGRNSEPRARGWHRIVGAAHRSRGKGDGAALDQLHGCVTRQRL